MDTFNRLAIASADPVIGLMQNIMFYILWLQSILIQKLFDRLRNLLHRELKDFLAIHGRVADLRFRISQEITNSP